MRLLLFSNSTNAGESYLEYPVPYIREFLGNAKLSCAFVPYAAVSFGYDEYLEKVKARFEPEGYEIDSVHNHKDPAGFIREADCVVVGGGNTWHLLKSIQDRKLVDVIREEGRSGKPYIGWSAGSNLACPTIKTTNDMPVIQPSSFEGLSLIPFQINPHYTDARIPNHNGESREDRIREYLELNPDILVVGLKEGTMLQIIDDSVKLLGNKTMKIFRKDLPTLEYDSNASIDFILKQ
jgi:dipeptidase E